MRGLLLLAFGGPRSLSEVGPFLTRLFRDRKPSKEVLEKVKDRYRLIGGGSPLPKITWEQAKGVERRLAERGYSFRAYVGMRFSSPFIEEALREIVKDGITEVIAVPMTPFQSRESTGAYIEEVKRVQKMIGESLKVSFVVGWSMHPSFLDSIRERIREGLMGFPPEERKKAYLLFTAHSLPKTIAEKDPYGKEIMECIEAVVHGLEHRTWKMAYQSRGSGPEEWLEPDVGSVLEDLSKRGVRNVLVVPIGFVSDHVETLYDIDIVERERAKALGIRLERSPSLNSSEKFITALTSIVEEHLKEEWGIGS